MISARYGDVRRAVEELRGTTLAKERGDWLELVRFDPAWAGALWAREFGRGGEFDAALTGHAAALKSSIFGGRVDPIAPLYVTSICTESCLYCNFRAPNKGVGVERRRLSDEEVEAEARFLIEDKGIHLIELVYASDPLMQADVICRHIKTVQRVLEQNGGGGVGVNAEPFEENDYRRMAEAGVSFVALWQETYDRERYLTLHPGARKKNFEYRLNCPERMIAGGVDQIGMGILSGLAPWREDWAMLLAHEAYLRRRYGVPAAILGIPRLRPTAGAPLQQTPFIPTSEELRAVVALHNIFSPETKPFLSTRESWEDCSEMARGGGCLFTFNCSTTPGGYSLGRGGSQFSTGSFDAPAAAEALRKVGLSPIHRGATPSPDSASASRANDTALTH